MFRLLFVLLLLPSITTNIHGRPIRKSIVYRQAVSHSFKRHRPRPVSFTEYDRSGKVIAEGYYGESVCRTTIVKHGPNQTTISENCFRIPDNIGHATFYYYDSSQRRLHAEMWRYHNNEKSYLSEKIVYRYNLDGTLVREQTFDSDDTLQETRIYRHMDRVLIKEVWRPGDTAMELIASDTTLYNASGKPVYLSERLQYGDRRISRFVQDSITFVREYIYNAQGILEMIRQAEHAADGQTKEIIIYSGNGILTDKFRYLYNRRRLLKRINHYDARDILLDQTRYRYLFF